MTAKALVLSGGDGTAVPSGYVGEKISSTISVVTCALNSTATVSSITVTSGVWIIYCAFNAYIGVPPPAGQAIAANMDFYNSTDSAAILLVTNNNFGVVNNIGTGGAGGIAGAGEAFYSYSTPFVCSANKTILLRLRCDSVVGAGTGATSVVRTPTVGQGFYAIRIA